MSDTARPGERPHCTPVHPRQMDVCTSTHMVCVALAYARRGGWLLWPATTSPPATCPSVVKCSPHSHLFLHTSPFSPRPIATLPPRYLTTSGHVGVLIATGQCFLYNLMIEVFLDSSPPCSFHGPCCFQQVVRLANSGVRQYHDDSLFSQLHGGLSVRSN